VQTSPPPTRATVLNNPYRYTNNNPLNLTDPNGKFPTDDNIVCNTSSQAARRAGMLKGARAQKFSR